MSNEDGLLSSEALAVSLTAATKKIIKELVGRALFFLVPVGVGYLI